MRSRARVCMWEYVCVCWREEQKKRGGFAHVKLVTVSTVVWRAKIRHKRREKSMCTYMQTCMCTHTYRQHRSRNLCSCGCVCPNYRRHIRETELETGGGLNSHHVRLPAARPWDESFALSVLIYKTELIKIVLTTAQGHCNNQMRSTWYYQ